MVARWTTKPRAGLSANKWGTERRAPTQIYPDANFYVNDDALFEVVKAKCEQ
jgi:hypothetical protein